MLIKRTRSNRQVAQWPHIIPTRTSPNRRGRRRLQSLVAELLGSVGSVSRPGDMARSLVKLRNHDFGAFPMEEMALTEIQLTARATDAYRDYMGRVPLLARAMRVTAS